ncbi:MAG: hypothetical protein KJ706_09020 [Candidatus Omnitrophica bacterium]|nr:hypothetical protein [Candidatus Omnitrophota bacterium]
MLKTQREKTILKQGLIAVGVIAGLYVFILSPFLREGSSILDDELERKTREIKKYIAATGSFPSKESFDKLEKEGMALQRKFEELADFIDPEKTRISDASSEAGLYFIEKLHDLMKRFSEEASSKGVELPENLGFGDGLPKESMVESLLRQLETAELAISVLLESETIEFSAIKPLKSIEYIEPLSKDVLYTELPLQISMRLDTDAFVNLLLELKNASPIVSVKEVHIKSDEENLGDIEASLVLSTFRVARRGTEK